MQFWELFLVAKPLVSVLMKADAGVLSAFITVE
jgi:hypothetical protein